MISYVHQVEIDLQQWTGIKHWSEYQTDHADNLQCMINLGCVPDLHFWYFPWKQVLGSVSLFKHWNVSTVGIVW